MTFLELVQKAIRWSGVRSTEPTTLTEASGLVQNFADQVAAAWKDIQLERLDWRWNKTQKATGVITSGNQRFFIRSSAATGGTDNKINGIIEYSTTDGTPSITPATLDDLQPIFEDAIVGINDDTTQFAPDKDLHFIKWEDWAFDTEDLVDTTDEGNLGEPNKYTITPNGELIVFPIPDQNYRLFFEVPRVPQVLENDADAVTKIPDYMQDGIIWRGILYYAMFIQDPGLIAHAQARYNPYKQWLEQRDMPDVTLRFGALY